MDENVEIKKFLALGFDEKFSPKVVSVAEKTAISDIVDIVEKNISGQARPRRYVLGLALDFTFLAQRLSNSDTAAKLFQPDLTESLLFSTYSLITSRGNTTANTLTLEYGSSQEGIRRIEEHVVDFFHSINRSGYPSAYVYNTGQWHKFKDLLLLCFRLSESAKYILCEKLIAYGFSIFPRREYFGRETVRPRTFEAILLQYPRADASENGGLVLQSIANGYYSSDRPHLSIIADKVRTGSARQKRFGDIDCYFGLDLELSIEVKDMHLDNNNYQNQLGSFINMVSASGVFGTVFCKSIESSTRVLLQKVGLTVLTVEDAISIVRTWDYPKQDSAMQGMLHHIAHVEQNVEATSRLLMFVKSVDATHSCLAYANHDGKSSI